MPDYKQIVAHLEAMGIMAVYGGGEKPGQKGDGFWIAYGTFGNPESIENSGNDTGNCRFWLTEDIVRTFLLVG